MSAVACLCAAAAYAAGSGAFRTGTDDKVAVPVTDRRTAGYCAALHALLPSRLNGLPRHDLKPRSDLVAGWGRPTVVLRCGVPRPAVDADPDTPAASVGGVTWSFEQDRDGGVRMTTTLRKAYVELYLPPEYAHDAGPLVDLAAPVRRSVPEGI
ncbi:DUF3515 family protein [Actinacidiphila sp. ITFR-21]|uniref:DUF3515 family protein n=1 Tax=Actinacidiphila sp. ITFR-21 TaxID=3075199 RepID=UPI00288BCC96|nr:DUF3515 family protein [Streptomyces sp. ITFR-21]WNI18259.1 DUF3515 family protein [Streptomyces sp. ITFR-21]